MRKEKDLEMLLRQVEEDEQRQRKNSQGVGGKPEEGYVLEVKQEEPSFIQESSVKQGESS